MTTETRQLVEDRDDDGNERVVDITDEATGAIEPLVYFGTDFDVHGLVRRLNSGEILIPSFDPENSDKLDVSGFQRKFVWSVVQKNRFIESLLLGFPVPGVFLVQQSDRRLLVLDGQQRLRTLQTFYAGQFTLEGVTARFEGLSYHQLDAEDRRVLDNTFIHATIVKHEAESDATEEAVYQLFERLNTGGTNLHAHEIRVALHGGPLIDLVRSLNSNVHWRALYGARNSRLKDQELILRFLAFFKESAAYERPLHAFLNQFTKRHRNLEDINAAQITALFDQTCDAIERGVGRAAFRTKNAINAALVDAVMVGMARRVEAERNPANPDAIREAHSKLLSDPDFQSAIGRATADPERVRRRLEKATIQFAST